MGLASCGVTGEGKMMLVVQKGKPERGKEKAREIGQITILHPQLPVNSEMDCNVGPKC